MFVIELQSQRETGQGSGSPAGASEKIVIGDFTEAFRVPLGFWDESGYRRSWRRAFEMLRADEIEGPFDPAAPWNCVGPGRGIDEDGNQVSEWVMSMDPLREFFR